ncbi:malonyl-CoA-acyl carrier protein transacylase beg isoform X2 [Nomia melanderi]|nr:probable malonyl-CoA-acyl carrier protein transacylase, mitochondrial isoform X2 [Nomia melanderi]
MNNKEWNTTPYPADILETEKPKNDSKDFSVVLFPGQGIIKVGMIQKYIHFPGVKDLFDITNELLGYNLLKLCLEGPQEKLNRTEFNQVATVISSIAGLEKVREERPNVFNSCIATAGYSVGEISALIFSGVISFEDGIRLASVRGKAMQYASDKLPQGMLSITCTPTTKIHKACEDAIQWAIEKGVENPICRVAVFLSTERKILAGNIETLEYIESHRKEYGLTNLNRLPVSGAFHTVLMEPAVKAVSTALNSITIDEPRCKVYSNYKAEPYKDMKFAKKLICKQMVSPVKWEQCIQRIYNRPQNMSFPRTLDIGSEGRMKTILKMINAKAAHMCIVV